MAGLDVTGAGGGEVEAGGGGAGGATSGADEPLLVAVGAGSGRALAELPPAELPPVDCGACVAALSGAYGSGLGVAPVATGGSAKAATANAAQAALAGENSHAKARPAPTASLPYRRCSTIVIFTSAPWLVSPAAAKRYSAP